MSPDDVTTLLEGIARGESDPRRSAEQLLPIVYDELRRRARAYLRREAAGHSLDPTALVHEAYERLVVQSRVDWRGRTHFVAVAAQAMRRLLIDHARGRGRDKRGGGWQRLTIANLVGEGAAEIGLDELVGIDRALEKLAAQDSRSAAVLELRIFGGLGSEEIAAHLAVSERTVRSDWAFARAWLRKELAGDTL
jgi:RNA polymerase sigma factor (TIGR02999 family)